MKDKNDDNETPKAKRQKTATHWSIPLTAPAFTPIQEQEERDNLPEADREYLRQELYGQDQPLEIDEVEEQAILRQLEEYLTNFINEDVTATEEANTLSSHPYCDKTVYLEALERCPDIVEKETNPLMFLRATNYKVEVSESSGMSIDIMPVTSKVPNVRGSFSVISYLSILILW
jgi:hypothetical protein